MENIIKVALKHNNKSIKWLAKQLKCNYQHLCKKINNNNLTLNEIEQMLSYINTTIQIVLLNKNNKVIVVI